MQTVALTLSAREIRYDKHKILHQLSGNKAA